MKGTFSEFQSKNIDTDQSFYVSIISSFIAFFYFLGRLGFHDGLFIQILNLLGFSFFVFYFPPTLKSFIKEKDSAGGFSWTKSEPFYLLVALLIVTFSGMIRAHFSINVAPVFIILGLLFFILDFVRRIFGKVQRLKVVNIFILLGFSMYLVGRVWGGEMSSPLFIENLMAGGSGNTLDTFFHGALSHIIQTFNFSSTGLDGLVFCSYHFG